MFRASFFLVFLLLAGCSTPSPGQIASWIADGISYLTTNKSLTDHGLSLAFQQDCAVLHFVNEGALCREDRRKRGENSPYAYDDQALYDHVAPISGSAPCLARNARICSIYSMLGSAVMWSFPSMNTAS